MGDADPIEQLKEGFQAKSLSEITQKRWLYIANDFLTFISKRGITFNQAKEEQVKEYLAYKKRSVSGNGMKTIYYILKSMYKIWDKKWKIDAVPHGREPERPYFSIDETKQMMEAGRLRSKQRGDFIGIRDLVMMLISIDTGTRRIQIHRLNRENYMKDKILRIPPSFKGGSWTDRKLRNETVKFIDVYMVARKKRLGDSADDADSPLFIDKSNARISPEAMGWAFDVIKKSAGIVKPGGAYHGFRRSKTTRLHKGGMSETEITKALGWKAGSREPSIYIQLDQKEVQDKANKADGLMSEEEL